jgi:hypothetical protein
VFHSTSRPAATIHPPPTSSSHPFMFCAAPSLPNVPHKDGLRQLGESFDPPTHFNSLATNYRTSLARRFIISNTRRRAASWLTPTDTSTRRQAQHNIATSAGIHLFVIRTLLSRSRHIYHDASCLAQDYSVRRHFHLHTPCLEILRCISLQYRPDTS